MNLFCPEGSLEQDVPQFGYLVRSEQEGWLQGFISATTFSTRHKWLHQIHLFVLAIHSDAYFDELPICFCDTSARYNVNSCSFEWNSSVIEAGVANDIRRSRKCDEDGSFARVLQAQHRVENPSRKVIEWKRSGSP